MQQPIRRKEGLQRVQIGLSGLAAVVLLVGLANVVAENIRQDDAAMNVAEAAATNVVAATPPPVKPTEPLAELGVAPAASDPAQQPVVADLQPDPNLKERMDQPPPVAPTLSPERRGQPQN